MSRLTAATLSVLLTLAAARAEAGEGAAVAILDFTVQAAESNHWAWAEGGLADLLQIELERLGLVTLDRDFIQAVLAEQRLNAGPLTAPGQLKLAALRRVAADNPPKSAGRKP